MSADTDQSPRPPAAAYHAVARYMPPDYFTTRPVTDPDEGCELYAIGSDGVRTQWVLPNGLASALGPLLRQDPNVTSFWFNRLKGAR